MSYLESLPPELQQEIIEFVDSRVSQCDREAAISFIAFRMWAIQVREMHERFLAQLRSTAIAPGDSLADIERKTEEHQSLLRWHHAALHGIDEGF